MYTVGVGNVYKNVLVIAGVGWGRAIISYDMKLGML
jgi:hypothetical protein